MARDEYSTSRPTGTSGGADCLATACRMIWRWLGMNEEPDQVMIPPGEWKVMFPAAKYIRGATNNHGSVAAAIEFFVQTSQHRNSWAYLGPWSELEMPLPGDSR